MYPCVLVELVGFPDVLNELRIRSSPSKDDVDGVRKHDKDFLRGCRTNAWCGLASQLLLRDVILRRWVLVQVLQQGLCVGVDGLQWR